MRMYTFVSVLYKPQDTTSWDPNYRYSDTVRLSTTSVSQPLNTAKNRKPTNPTKGVTEATSN
jgi:hypothetical protein